MTAAGVNKSFALREPRSERSKGSIEGKNAQRNGQATRQRIVDAAIVEFAATGLAGARVDRIAATARCNKSLIFVYFESKAALFETIVGRELEHLNKEVNFASSDVRQLAAKLFDFAMKNANSMRLLAWYGLEAESGGREGRLEPYLADETLANWASWPGALRASLSSNFLLTAVVALATAWSQGNPLSRVLASNEDGLPNSSREMVVEWVARLVE